MKKYVQCPRCELNYITTPGDKYCKVCMREMKGEGGQDDVEMCSVCNENPALPGRDICLFCLKEMNAQAAESVGAASDDSGDGDGEQATPQPDGHGRRRLDGRNSDAAGRNRRRIHEDGGRNDFFGRNAGRRSQRG